MTQFFFLLIKKEKVHKDWEMGFPSPQSRKETGFTKASLNLSGEEKTNKRGKYTCQLRDTDMEQK